MQLVLVKDKDLDRIDKIKKHLKFNHTRDRDIISLLIEEKFNDLKLK